MGNHRKYSVAHRSLPPTSARAGIHTDSIINSVSDTFAMFGGFLLAWRMPVWATIFTALFLEVWVGYTIRDNLTLNIVNLLHQFDFIKAWQSGIL
jgi:hypothetical protein